MKHFLISISLISVLIAYQQKIDIATLKKDPTMIQYKKVMHELMGRNYRAPTDPNIIKGFLKNPTKDNMKKLYKDSGMKNADEYVDKLFLQMTLMFDFLKKHPEISKLDAARKQELIKALLAD